MLHHWASIEADFYREYRIDLVVEIKKISWRRFCVLLSGLSPNSLWANIVNSAEIVLDGEDGERAVSKMWG